MAKKKIFSRKEKDSPELREEEIVHEAEKQGDLSHEEAEQILADDDQLELEVEAPEVLPADDESDVKRPELTGKAKPKFEHPGTNNQSIKIEKP